MADTLNTTRRAFLSATGRVAIAAGAAGVLASCAVTPVLAGESKMTGLIEAHREALARYDAEMAKLEELEAKAPPAPRIVLSRGGNIVAKTEDYIRRFANFGMSDAWIERNIGDLRAAKAAYWKAWDQSGIREQDLVAAAAATAETIALNALIACRPETLDEVRAKATYFQSCGCFVDSASWNGVTHLDVFASLAPAA